MKRVNKLLIGISLLCASCASTNLPPFSSQSWHIDTKSGHAVSDRGTELAFGSDWMITDTALIQSDEQVATYPKLATYLAAGLSTFNEIAIDSVLFYHPSRGLLFATYHQTVPLKPAAEIAAYNEGENAYSKEYARIFGHIYTHIDDTGWEAGPDSTVFSNTRYNAKRKQFVMLQRLPNAAADIAVFVFRTQLPKKGKWWEEYPRGTFWRLDPGESDNLERISTFIHFTRSLAVENLKITSRNRE